MVKILNTGWSKWDIYLSQFVNKKIYILEIGSYKGDATSWFLNNLSSNKNTIVYAVDTWEGSPEYFNGDFKEVEEIFDKTTELTGKLNQLVKMKMLSTNALLELNKNKIMFDIIFIDASHEAIDVLSDAVLSWNILNENGVLIFDDYKWDKLENYHFRPKIAIDSFIDIYKTQLKILYIGYQAIVQKRLKDEFNKAVPGKYYELMNRLNIYDIPNLLCILKDKPKKIIYNLIIDEKVPLYQKEYGFDKEFFKLVLNKNKSKIKTGQKNELYDLHAFTRYIRNKDKIFELINLDDKLKKNNLIIKLIDFLDNNLNNSVIENICYISNNNLLKNISNKISFLNISQTVDHSNNIIKKFIKSKFNIKKIDYHDINLLSYKSKNNKSNVFFSEFKNINEIVIISKKINNKLDIFMGSLLYDIVKKVETKFQEQYYYIAFFNLIYFALSTQNKGGISIFGTFFLMTEPTIQLLWILKKYYKNVIITMADVNVINSFTNKIICSGFKGISKKELDEIFKIGLNIYEKVESFNNTTFTIQNIIDINSNQIKEYNNFKNKIVKYNIERYNLLKYNQQIINDIIFFNDKNDLSKYKRENMINKIFIAQLKYLISWVNKYNILENIDFDVNSNVNT